MKLLDPFSGYRLAYGNTLLHLGYFIAIWLLDKGETCSSSAYETARIALLVSHMLVVAFQFIAYLVSLWGNEIVSRGLDTFSLVVYQGAIFYTQTTFFVADKSCETQMPELHKWFMIEIISFYSLILSAIIYLFLGSLFTFKRGGLLTDDKKDTDFLTWTEDVYYQFGLTSALLGITAAVQIIEGGIECNDGTTSY